MPVAPTYPGIYIQEVSSGVRTITGVATGIAAFVGSTQRGIDNRAKPLFSFSDFEREFGGLAADSELSYAVQHFFDNGGSQAYVVRVPRPDSEAAEVVLENKPGGGAKQVLHVTALSKGAWANNVLLDVDYEGVADDKSFNLTVGDFAAGTIERFRNLSMNPAAAKYVAAVINDEHNGSTLIQVEVIGAPADRPASTGTTGGDIDLDKIKDPAKAYTLKVTADLPAALKDIEVTIFDKQESRPTSMTGLCRLVERKINVALGAVVAGAAVHCSPVKTATGDALRIQAAFDPNILGTALDAKVTFKAGAGDDADVGLQLSAGVANVSYYRLGLGRNMLAQVGVLPGADGTLLPFDTDLVGKEADFSGIYALRKVDLFNLLCIPDATRATVSDPSRLDEDAGGNPLNFNAVYDAAMKLCLDRRAILLIDPPPPVSSVEKAVDWKSFELTVHDKNGAAYFPRLRLPDPLNKNQLRTFAPCGVVAGLMSRIDADRGFWKAPAGTEAILRGVQAMAYDLTDGENGALNQLGLNCFRTFPLYGRVAWGARTLVGADAEANEWKYLPVRRVALYIEESLYRGTKWVVFEPNDEPLWAQIRLNVGAFMNDLFRQGAFQGRTPREAYLVKCDKETTTQNDINRGVVNILVGFAPLKPAEFVIITITQLAGQIQV